MATGTHPDNVLTIRTATGADVALLVDLGIRTFSDTFAEMNTPSDMDLYLQKNFNADLVAAELSDASNVFLIAACNGTPAGYAKLRKSTAPPELKGTHAIELERLYATKEFIGKRVGKLLMNTCIDIAGGQGYDTLWLGVWEHNHRAIAFYRKCGFEKFGAHPFMLGTDLQTDDMMRKSIQRL